MAAAMNSHVCVESCESIATVVQCNHPLVAGDVKFPPEPLSPDQIAGISEAFCAGLSDANVTESGCSVCGQLCLVSAQVPVDDVSEAVYSLLDRPSVTVKERFDADELHDELTGPVLAPGCAGVCAVCVESLHLGRVPKFALANGLWIGEVPDELQGLSYAERMLVARSRHHRCLVRVAKSGMNKLRGNMVCYPNPYPKLYDVLPPHRDEFDSLLAVVFTGAARPTDEDRRRIPLVVRRNCVMRALNWLKLNNVLYRDVTISAANMDSYVDCELAPSIIYHEDSDVNNPVESRAADDSEDSVGISDGDCEFVVTGLASDVIDIDNYQAITAVAANHMRRGKSLAVPHGPVPDTLWHNSDLFPSMFPWLFPYGVGGICNSAIQGEMSEHAHKRHLLLYHDKRFQLDKEFALMAFNQEQIVLGSRAGSFLSTKSKFRHLADRLLNISHEVFGAIADNLASDSRWKPSTDVEIECFKLLGELDMVNSHVPGSITGKRYQRNELWSLLSYLGAPSWFVTFAPSDTKHPLCLYFASKDLPYDEAAINLLSDDSKWALVANNAVASARFFHFVVDLFIREVLRWGKDDDGLFGNSNAYYGTVEQQGRLTLHLHVLVWIRNAMSPEDIRGRLLSPDSVFQRSLIAYLDSCHQGRLVESTVRDTVARIEHTRMRDPHYVVPMQRLPRPFDGHIESNMVFQNEVNDLLCRTNKHRCKKHCREKGPNCKSRFPRSIVVETHVDDTGYIHVRHDEPWLNTVNPLLTYLMRCNTDVTCLLSGTAIKAVVAYATDYITKVGLKTPSMFQLIRNQLIRHSALIESGADRAEQQRKIVTGVINSFTSKSEIGAPLAASYLLDLPDHYKSHTFRPVYWKGFVSEVLSAFPARDDSGGDGEVEYPEAEYNVVVVSEEMDDGTVELYGVSPVQDYVYRPARHEGYCLYDWIRLYRKTKRSTRVKDDDALDDQGIVLLDLLEGVSDASYFRPLEEHPQGGTHAFCLDNSHANVVPNFVGGTLPRRDTGDRDYYSCTMLTLFKPWRTGGDLKDPLSTWSQAFDSHSFSHRQMQVMDYFNLRYECLDARDDYASHNRVGGMHSDESPQDGDCSGDIADLIGDDEGDDEHHPDDILTGKHRADVLRQASVITGILANRGWTRSVPTAPAPTASIDESQLDVPSSRWTARLQAAQLDRSLRTRPRDEIHPYVGPVADSGANSTAPAPYLVDREELDRLNLNSYPSVSGETSSERMARLVAEFTLNTEQERAFRIVARHFLLGEREPLHMYLAGMAGTGKSRVIHALTALFAQLGRSQLLLLLAPTGTAAANIGGHTYHSALGMKPDASGPYRMNPAVRSVLSDVQYIFIDEVSMISCADMKNISERLSIARNRPTDVFGGFNVIFAGDFGQLPPVLGQSLFSGTVGSKGSVGYDQRCAIGKWIWLQVTTVVVLRANMRQREMTDNDNLFRRALEHLRYKICDSADIAFLKTLISGSSTCPASLRDPEFRHLSLITGWNSHRDRINELGCEKFAADTGQNLEIFHSDDRVGKGDDVATGARARGRKTWLTHVSARVRQLLWDLPHYDSSNVPGVLRLCRGMPVIVKKNIATECGVTNGSEGVVVGWTSRPLGGERKCLDVLFVELRNTPIRVQIEGLPPNVVPICSIDDTVECTLPDGSSLSIRRKQVQVLPNFAMTDYSSQGKTRHYNLVDLHNLRSHMAYYTALSRSAYADKTVILQAFSEAKMTGGMSKPLMAEFRDIEILNEITRMECEGVLPATVSSRLRYTRIAQFVSTVGLEYRPADLPVELNWSSDESHAMLFRTANATCDEYDVKNLDTGATKRKRPADTGSVPLPRATKPRVPIPTGLGLQWDSTNWSCAYNALLSNLYQIWYPRRDNIGPLLSATTMAGEMLCSGLSQVALRVHAFDRVRNDLRRFLHSRHPRLFPYGKIGTSILDVAQALLFTPTAQLAAKYKCQSCASDVMQSEIPGGVIFVPSYNGLDRYLLNLLLRPASGAPCCANFKPSGVSVSCSLPVLVFSNAVVAGVGCTIPPPATLNVCGTVWRLEGLI